MKTFKKQIFIVFLGIIMVIILYSFPKYVVGDNNLNTTEPIENVENALKLIESNNPMEGVFMLRKILEKEPKNKEALFNLGVLSIQSKQYDKAIERFNQLLIIDSLDKRAYLHLGISNFELGNEEEANFFFDKVLRSNNNLLIEQLNLFLNKQ
tara:strand:- start:2025 stop:2483 length:459 start_codon:yes stop_codon:yes gene_type:complete